MDESKLSSSDNGQHLLYANSNMYIKCTCRHNIFVMTKRMIKSKKKPQKQQQQKSHKYLLTQSQAAVWQSFGDVAKCVQLTFNFPSRFFQEMTPLSHTACSASWFRLTSTPSGVTVKENATAEWASAILTGGQSAHWSVKVKLAVHCFSAGWRWIMSTSIYLSYTATAVRQLEITALSRLFLDESLLNTQTRMHII